jgi:pimeloyl-ACP methyl ester carboxylesterase
MDTLDLQDVVLVGWSWGCHDIYAYLRAFGTDNVRACVFIDTPPRGVAAQESDWASRVDMSQAADVINAVVYDFRGTIKRMIPPMMKREMRTNELAWALDQLTKTPNYAAALTIADFFFADYTQEAKMIDGRIAVLHVLSEGRAQAGKAWLGKNAPHSEVFVLGKHLMLWEFPDQSNAAVDAFLKRMK